MSTNATDANANANKPDSDKPESKTDSAAASAGKPGEGGGAGAGAPTPEKTFTATDIEAAEARGRKAAQDAAKQKEKDSKLPDDERLKQRAESAEAQLRERDARDQFTDAAREAGATNPTKIYRLVKDDIEFDEQGKPTNLKTLVATAKRDYAEEFGAKKPGGSVDGGAGKEGSAKRSMNDLIRGGRR